jgi:predicted enzyme related to lactoylglutathione lyase
MKMMLAWYAVKDLAAASKFYGETLGMNKVFEMPGWAEFGESMDGPCIGLSELEQGTGATVVLRVEDLDATRASMEQQGVQFAGPTQEHTGVVRLATFFDPAGNRLQLAQPLFK